MDSGDQDGGSGGLLTLHHIQVVHSCNEYTQIRTCPGTPEPAPCTAGGVKPGDPRDAGGLLQGSSDPEPPGTTEGAGEEQLERSDKLGLLGNVVETTAVMETRPDSRDPKGSPSSTLKGLRDQPEPDDVIKEQPRSSESKHETAKLLAGASSEENPVRPEKCPRAPPRPCERCGRCRCRKCAAAGPLPLPSCLLCGRRCLCSAESTIDYVTCACCLKALLYHCGSDDEDASADAPFSCHRQDRCRRWSTTAAATLVLPCLLCYGPLQGCLALCKLCHHHANRPGCRCRKV